jgi:hypothetical protein
MYLVESFDSMWIAGVYLKRGISSSNSLFLGYYRPKGLLGKILK